MCGLVVVGANRNGHTGQKVYNLYQKQDKRGKKGFGYLSIKNGRLTDTYRSKTEEGIKKFLMKDRSDLILFHHRLPTSTTNTLGTTHPMKVEHEELKYDYIFAHNGVVSNAHFLKTGHEKLGYKYRTEMKEVTHVTYPNSDREDEFTGESAVTKFNDSESLAIELARYLDGLTDKVNTYGGVAFWGVALYKGTNKIRKVYYGKNKGRDLKVSNNKKWFVVASETGKDIEDMTVTTIDYKTGKTKQEGLPIDEAKPAVSMGYRPNNYVSVNRKTYSSTDKYESYAHRQLKNAYYTYAQAIDSGVPLNDFYCSTHKMVKMYIPNKFLGVDVEKRLPYKEQLETVVYDDPTTIYSGKVIERIEELAKKYVKLEKAFDDLEEEKTFGMYADGYYKQDEQRLMLDLENVEDEISAMNIDENTQEFFIEKERDLIA